MRMIFYCFHQLLGQRQYVVLGAQYVVDGDAARDLLEVSEFNLQIFHHNFYALLVTQLPGI